MMAAFTPAHATGRHSFPLTFLGLSPMVRHFSLVWTPGRRAAYAVSWWCHVLVTDAWGGSRPELYERHAQEVVDSLNKLYATTAQA